MSQFYAGWRDLMDNKSDPRTNEWFLMSSPFPTIAISLTYAYCVKVIFFHKTFKAQRQKSKTYTIDLRTYFMFRKDGFCLFHDDINKLRFACLNVFQTDKTQKTF